MKKTSQKYQSSIKPVWCPGCGDYGVLKALQKTLADLEIEPENIMTISGIGCSGRFSHYMNTYSLHGTHGRALPTALGAKASRPDMTVFCVGGDGDGLGIGGGHVPHAARKNIDLTYILIDNSIYGLTKGQTSPTTPLNRRTKTAPYGAYEEPMEPIPIFISYGISFIARTSPVPMNDMVAVLKKAIQHKGFSMVYVLSPCVTFPIISFKQLKTMLKPVPEDHDPSDRDAAIKLAYSKSPVYTGVIFQQQKKTLGEHLDEQIEKAVSTTKNKDSISVKELLTSYA